MANDKVADGAGDTKTASATTDAAATAATAAAAAAATKTPEQIAADKTAADTVAAGKTTADTKTAAEAETARKAAEATAAAKAPEKYDLKLPDGSKDWLDENDLKAIETTAKAKGWTNDQAQIAVNEHAEALAAQSAAFRAATEADTTYGGDKLQDTQRLGSLALDKLRPKGTTHGDAFRSLLVKSGYGNNLEVVSFLADLGKLMAEDSHVAGGGAADPRGSRDAATVLYGDTKS